MEMRNGVNTISIGLAIYMGFFFSPRFFDLINLIVLAKWTIYYLHRTRPMYEHLMLWSATGAVVTTLCWKSPIITLLCRFIVTSGNYGLLLLTNK